MSWYLPATVLDEIIHSEWFRTFVSLTLLGVLGRTWAQIRHAQPETKHYLMNGISLCITLAAITALIVGYWSKPSATTEQQTAQPSDWLKLDDAKRWQFIQDMLKAGVGGQGTSACEAVVMYYPESYSRGTRDELQLILAHSSWNVDSGGTTTAELPYGINILAPGERYNDQAWNCALRLKKLLKKYSNIDAHLSDQGKEISGVDAKRCALRNCVVVDIGNDPANEPPHL